MKRSGGARAARSRLGIDRRGQMGRDRNDVETIADARTRGQDVGEPSASVTIARRARRSMKRSERRASYRDGGSSQRAISSGIDAFTSTISGVRSSPATIAGAHVYRSLPRIDSVRTQPMHGRKETQAAAAARTSTDRARATGTRPAGCENASPASGRTGGV